MATTPRQRNPRSVRIYDTQADRDDDVGVAFPGGTGTLYSRPIYGPQRIGQSSIQLIWTAGNTGTFTVWYTLKPNPELTTDTDWVQDTGVVVTGSSLAVAGAAGNTIIFVGNVLPEWIRVKYVNASGTGSILNGYSRIDGDR